VVALARRVRGMSGITVQGLVKRYPRSTDFLHFLRRPTARESVTALDGVDLELERGRVYGLVGRNGAGKTTLLKVLAGLVLPSAGRAEVCGIEVAGHPRALRAKVGLVVADERSFFWRISARENLRFFASLQHLRGSARRRAVDGTLERVGLAALGDVAFRELSTGQRQRLAIARGMLIDPEVLLMDEATRSLDPEGAREVRAFVREVARERPERLVVYSTHVLSEVEDLCDEAIALRAGRVGGRGRIEPTSEGVGRYLVRTRTAAPAGTWSDLAGVRELAAGALSRLELGQPTALERVVRRAAERGLGLFELRPEGSPLEEWIAGRGPEASA